MDSLVLPCKTPILPLVLNIFCPGFGSAVDGCYNTAGKTDIKVIAFGLILNILWDFSVFWLWWFFGLGLLLGFVIHVITLYHGYLIMQKK